MRKGFWHRWPAPVTAGVLAGFAALTAGCSSGAGKDAATPVVAVQVATAARGPLEQWVRTQAVLYPLHQAIITPKISAPVKQFFVQRGDRVHAGELLAVLENDDLKAAAQQAQGQLEQAQAAYATATAGTIPAELKKAQLDVTAAQKADTSTGRIYQNSQSLYQQGAIPRRTLDEAGVSYTDAQNALQLAQQHLQAVEHGGHAQALKAAQGALAAAEGQSAAAQANLSYSEIRSPMDGVVTDRPMYPGELATPSSPLMTIMDLDHMVARAPLPADQAALLKTGDTATIQAPGASGGGGAPLPAHVSVVSPATDPSSTTIEVWVEAANPGDALRPGTSVEAAMLARTLPAALTVPAAAVLTDTSGQASVMVVDAKNVAHQTNVTVGVRDPDRVQILTGLAAGQTVVTVGAYGLPDQSQVQIVKPAPADKGGDSGDAGQ